MNFAADKTATLKYLASSPFPLAVRIASIDLSTGASAKAQSGSRQAVEFNASDDAVSVYENESLTIRVTAEDASTDQTYTINFVAEQRGLRHVISTTNGGAGDGVVPSDLSTYDELTQTVLKNYNSGATVLARYVAIDGASANCGLSWDAACSSVATTLAGISDASADRIYLLLIASSGDASYDAGEALRMQNHVAIVGGWDASGGWDRSGTTVLSGGGAHRVIDNRYTETNPLNTALLYGVSLENGFARGNGSGIYNDNASPILVNVTIANNSTIGDGGGISNNNSSPVLTNVTIANNDAVSRGGGIHNINSSSPILTNVNIANNSAGGGGGVANSNSSSILTNVTIANNSAGTGGGVANSNSSSILTNVTIANNFSFILGGGIFNSSSSSSVLTNVTIVNNSAGSGGGIYNTTSSSAIIVNSILWDNSSDNGSQIYARDRGRITLAYSLLQDGANAIGLGDSPPTIVTAGISSADPVLGDLTTDAGSLVSTMAIGEGSSADDLGLYVRRSGNIYYYSEDESDWYTDLTDDTQGGSGLIDLTSDSIAEAEGTLDLTATDATGKARENRPDAGAYEYISESAAP